MSLPASWKQTIRARAGNRCEYCRMHEAWEPFYPYHVEHVIAQQHRGQDSMENLALACRHCNLLKGPNLTSLDPDGDQLVRLFHPRQQIWREHFEMIDGHILGLTNVGRTTVFLLEMNAPHRRELRMENLSEW